MKQFRETDARECAVLVVSTVPLLMSNLRADMRSHRPEDISIPQFRTLIFLNHHVGASLSEVAEHMGLTLSTTSKLIDGLVKRGLVTRTMAVQDRRRVELVLTPEGSITLGTVRHGAQTRMEDALSSFTPEELATVTQAMRLLQSRFSAGRGAAVQEGKEDAE